MARRRGIVIAFCLLIASCGGGVSKPHLTAPAQPQPPHIFLIVMENHSVAEVMRGQYVASLADKYGVAANYHAIAHPSVPNYLALTSGSTWGVQDDSYYVLPKRDLGSELTDANLPWRAYMEGLTDAGCLNSPVPYDPGHNPFAYYGGRCPSNVVPLTSLENDLKSTATRFTWISPDRCHDTHDCPMSVGDDWLSEEVPLIIGSPAFKSNGVLLITWDEDDGSTDNTVLTLVIRAGMKHTVSRRAYTHYSLLATVESLLGVNRLAKSAQASTMSDLVPGA